jgi:hypothetical protein
MVNGEMMRREVWHIHNPATTLALAVLVKEFTSSFPIGSGGDERAQSTHSYVSLSQSESARKSKSTTKITAVAGETEDRNSQDSDYHLDIDEAFDALPDALPSSFKLPRKILKVCSHVLLYAFMRYHASRCLRRSWKISQAVLQTEKMLQNGVTFDGVTLRRYNFRIIVNSNADLLNGRQ